MRQLCGPVAILGILLGCSADPGPTVIFPSQSANAVSNALIDVRLGGMLADKVRGDLPAATNSANAPKVSSEITELSANTNSRVLLEVKVDSEGPLQALYAKVLGAAEFYQVQLSATKVQGVFGVGFGIPSNFADGRFCVQTGVRDQFGQVGQNPEAICITVNSDLDAVPPPTRAPTNPPAPTTPPQPTAQPQPSATPQPSVTPAATMPTLTPTPMPTPPVVGEIVPEGSARDCWFDEWVPGYTRRETVRQTRVDTGEFFESTADWVIAGPATYRGMETVELVIYPDNSERDAQNDITTFTDETHSYRVPDDANQTLRVLGAWTETDYRANQQDFRLYVYAETEYDPPPDYQLTRFNLEPGESYTTTTVWRSRSLSRTNNDPATENRTEGPTIELTQTTTYLGREWVTVPAGTFETCRFDFVISSETEGHQGTGDGTINYAVDYGFRIRNTAENSISELVSATVNGVLVQ